MTWIILKQDIPIENPPPFFSIHWALPWAQEEMVTDQKRRQLEVHDDRMDDGFGFGWEPDASRAMRIEWDGQAVRVWPNEYNIVKPANMRLYVYGDPHTENSASHTLVPLDAQDAIAIRLTIDTDLRDVYDAALMDGCTPGMAQSVVLGIDVTDIEAEFPPIGWYECHPAYLAYFGR